MKEYNFTDSLYIGKQGESKIKNFLNNNFDEIIDVSDMKRFQQLDIDYVCKKGNQIITVEVKTDTYNSGNLFYEYYSCIEKETEGCLEKTKADYILYYFIYSNELYILKTNEFRKWFHKNIFKFKCSYVCNTMGNIKFNSLGYCISKNILESDFNEFLKITLN